MIHFDPLYLIIMLGTTALAMWASWRVKAAYNTYSQVPAMSGLSGAQIARRILDLNNIHDVEVVPTQGLLSDHYDPQNKRLVLCEENYHGTNVAALGVAAHEAAPMAHGRGGHHHHGRPGHSLHRLRSLLLRAKNRHPGPRNLLWNRDGLPTHHPSRRV
jgi:Zn-dependent membrane protease YugP